MQGGHLQAPAGPTLPRRPARHSARGSGFESCRVQEGAAPLWGAGSLDTGRGSGSISRARGRPDPVPCGGCAGRGDRGQGLFLPRPGPAPSAAALGIKIAASGREAELQEETLVPGLARSLPPIPTREAGGGDGGLEGRAGDPPPPAATPASCHPGTEPGLAAQPAPRPGCSSPPSRLRARARDRAPRPPLCAAPRPHPRAPSLRPPPAAPARPSSRIPARPGPAPGLTSALRARRPPRRPRPAHAGGWGGALGSAPRGLPPPNCSPAPSGASARYFVSVSATAGRK